MDPKSYKDYVISPRPRRPDNGGEWSLDVFIYLYKGELVAQKHFPVNGIFKTEKRGFPLRVKLRHGNNRRQIPGPNGVRFIRKPIMPTFRSIEELRAHAIEALNKDLQFEPIVFSEDIIISTVVSGESWDGLIDPRIARYVLDLQDSVHRLYQDVFDIDNEDLLKLLKAHAIVKIRVGDGSTSIDWKNAKEILEGMLSNMDGWKKVIVLTVLFMTAGGCYSFKTWTEYKLSEVKTIQDEETKRSLIDALNQARSLGCRP